jgi:hypothetical protein
LLRAFPSLTRKFPTYAAYGATQLHDIFPPERLENADVLEARTFASIIAMNSGGGTFTPHELPTEAQFAPIRSVVADDFDGDGMTDLLIGANFFGVPPVRGRYDADYGLYLRGDGNGGLKVIEPSESGLWFGGQIRKLRIVRSAHGPLIVAARNNDSLQFVTVGRRSPEEPHVAEHTLIRSP